jgi:membrane protein
MTPLKHLLKRIFFFIWQSLTGWFAQNPFLYAASLAYYTLFSLAPLLVIAMAVANLVFAQATIERAILRAIQPYVGPTATTAIAELIQNSQDWQSSRLTSVVGIALTIYGASMMFWQLRLALNAMWGVVIKAETVRQSLISSLKSYLLAFSAVIIVGLILLVSLILTVVWVAIPRQLLLQLIPNYTSFEPWLNLLASPLVLTALFFVIFKTVPKAKIRWRDVWPGAVLTAVLFWLGSYIIGLYLSMSQWASVFGTASSFIALLLWVYYSALILLFGAKFTQVYANMFGRPLIPDSDAILSNVQF